MMKSVLTDPQIRASQASEAVARMNYGNAVEKMVRNTINSDPLHSQVLRHVGGPSRPDFVGLGGAAGARFDITTPLAWPAHQARSYGPGLVPVFYKRPSTFTRLP